MGTTEVLAFKMSDTAIELAMVTMSECWTPEVLVFTMSDTIELTVLAMSE